MTAGSASVTILDTYAWPTLASASVSASCTSTTSPMAGSTTCASSTSCRSSQGGTTRSASAASVLYLLKRDGVVLQGQGRVPRAERCRQLAVECPGADLQEQVSALGRPPHLLLLDHPLANHLVYGGLDERTRDHLATPIPLPILRDAARIGTDIAAELGHRLQELALLRRRVLDVKIISRSSTI